MRGLALAARARRFVARRDGCVSGWCAGASRAERAALNVLISSVSSWRRVSIESTMSWVDFILLMLRMWPVSARHSARIARPQNLVVESAAES